ncbi:MAG: hypothetical protein WC428_00675 [Candidatus Paceibacterota bacterium]|jgi:hypothetical protein
MEKFEVPDFLKINISPYLEFAKFIAKQRHEQKKSFASCKQLSPNYEIVGVLGEIIYQIQLNEVFDHRLLIDGDEGFDFKHGVDVKSSEESKAEHLIEYQDKNYSNIYVFVKINLEERYGYIYSWIFGNEFEKIAKVRNFGYGDRNSIMLEEMKPYYTYPPYIKKIIYDLEKTQYVLSKHNELQMNKFIEFSKKSIKNEK